MERTFIKGLGAAAASVIVLTMNFYISSCSGGSAPSPASDGNQPAPKYTIVTKQAIPAGSHVVFECPSCKPSGASGRDTTSTGGSGHPTNPKYIQGGKVIVDIPANTELIVTFPRDPDPADPNKE